MVSLSRSHIRGAALRKIAAQGRPRTCLPAETGYFLGGGVEKSDDPAAVHREDADLEVVQDELQAALLVRGSRFDRGRRWATWSWRIGEAARHLAGRRHTPGAAMRVTR